jgi:hypothetical protein
MNLKALTVALVLGTSSVAMADSSIGFQFGGEVSARWNSGPVVRDHRNVRPTVVRPIAKQRYQMVSNWSTGHADDCYDQYQPRSVTLANAVEFAGADTRTIHVGSRAGAFTTLELQAVAGTPEIQRIFIQYDDGSEQAFDKLNVTLHRAPLVLTLNTVPRAIQKIVVYAPGYGTAQRQYSDFRNAEGLFRITAR